MACNACSVLPTLTQFRNAAAAPSYAAPLANTTPGESSNVTCLSRWICCTARVTPGVLPVATTRARFRLLMSELLPTLGKPTTPVQLQSPHMYRLQRFNTSCFARIVAIQLHVNSIAIHTTSTSLRMLQIANNWQPQQGACCSADTVCIPLPRIAHPRQEWFMRTCANQHAGSPIWSHTSPGDLPIQQALLTLLYRATIALSIPCSSRVGI